MGPFVSPNEKVKLDHIQMDESLIPDRISVLETALEIRAFEEGMLREYASGKIRGTVHTCVGQELFPAVLSEIITENDWLFGGHRAHGHFLARTGEYSGLAAEIMGKEGATSLGIGGSQHLSGVRFFTNGIQGGMLPIAAGTVETRINDEIAIAVIGDGTLGEGLFYETLNCASIMGLPLLVAIENNGIAQSTPQALFLAGDIRTRADAFDVKYFETDSRDLTDMYSTVTEAVAYVRAESKPALLNVISYRLNSHSKGDDNRSPEVISDLKSKDLLNGLINSSVDIKNLSDQASDRINAIISEVKARKSAESVFEDFRHRINELSAPVLPVDESLNFSSLSRERIAQVLSSSPAHKFVGEDILTTPILDGKTYSGAFGVSSGLSTSFEGQVIGTPIAEAFIAGFGIGRALAGNPTIVEIMFGDFATLIVDQVRQQASKLVSMYGRFLKLPVLFRMPMGGRRGYGPTHSQNLEGMFLGIPNVVVIQENGISKEESLFGQALSLELPVLFIESKDLYPKSESLISPAGYTPFAREYPNITSPWVSTPPSSSPEFTLVTYGYAAHIAAEAIHELALQEELFVDFFVLDVVSPLNLGSVLKSAQKTGKMLVVEEAIPSQGILSSLVAEISKMGATCPAIYSVGGNGDIGASQFSEDSAFLNSTKVIETALRYRGNR